MIAWLLLLGALEPAVPPRPSLPAVRVVEAPHLDGKLDDAAWANAPAFEAFVQKFPDEGKPPSERTRVRAVYDDHALYFALECEQRVSPIVARLTRRDRPIEADHVSVDLDTRRDGKSAFSFTVNAAGVLSDGIRFNDTDISMDWDENWDARTVITERGWTAELRIPLRILRFDALPVQDWGIQVSRFVSARQERDELAYIPREGAGEVSRYGRLTGLQALQPGGALELRPFVLGRVRRRDAADAMLASGTDATGSAGLDLKAHLSQALTLDAAINPDFAQVEADQVVLNLTTFETFYPEKRPFFLEGTDVFSTPIQLLYTRRIGRAPTAPALRDGEQLVDVPDPATIYGATKLVGAVGGGLHVGLLSAVTGRNDVTVQTADGSRGERLVDPLTSWNALRLREDVGDNGHVGLLLTAATRIDPKRYPDLPPAPGEPAQALCPSGDVVIAGRRCFHDAYVAAADGRWRSPSGDYAAAGQLVGTLMRHGPPRLLPDGTVISSGDASLGGRIYVAKEGGQHWVWELEYDAAGKQLDYNDVGYMQRQNLHHASADLEYRTLTPWWHTLETHSRLELYDRRNFDGLQIARGYQINTSAKMDSFWHYFVELHYREAHFDDREIGNGVALERAGLGGLEVGIDTDPRGAVSAGFFTTTQLLGNGLLLEAGGHVAFRLHPQLDLELLPEASYTAGEPRFVGTGAGPGQYLFGKLDARSLGATLRATFTFTPRLTLQSYAQLFLASGHYSAFSSFTAASAEARPAIHLADLQPGPGPGANPDFQDGALNVNVVLRWEYTLGSTLYVVYTRSQVPRTGLLDGQIARLDLGALHRGPAADVFLVKLSYWWG